MEIKGKIIKILCSIVVFCFFIFCPVLAEQNPGGQAGQSSVSGGQMTQDAAQGALDMMGVRTAEGASQSPQEPTVSDAGGSRTGGDAADELWRIDGTVTLGEAEQKSIDQNSGNGYTWTKQGEDSYVLTLKKVHIKGTDPAPDSGESRRAFFIELSQKAEILVKTEGDRPSVLEGGIGFPETHPKFHMIFDGAAVTINGMIAGGSDDEQVTVRKGSKVTVEVLAVGASGNAASKIVVDGAGSELTIIERGLLVDFLHVVGGGKLTVKGGALRVYSQIELDKESVIAVYYLPAFVEEPMGDKYSYGALKGIEPYIQQLGYHLGFGKTTDEDGTSFDHYTVLDADNEIVGNLTLKWIEEPEESEKPTEKETKEEESGTAPETEEPEESEKPTEKETKEEESGTAPETEAPEEVKPDTGGSDEEVKTEHNDSPGPRNTERKPESEPETETETESAAASDSTDNTGTKVLDASPYTGDRDSTGLWAACAISSAAALCLAALRLKAGRGRQ